MQNLDQLAGEAVKIAARAAADYARKNGATLTAEALEAPLKLELRAALGSALDDAAEAAKLGMLDVAEATFRASMALAGINAARQALAGAFEAGR